MRAIQDWLDRFCSKHPRLSIPGLMRYIIIGNVIVYLLDMFSNGHYFGSQLLNFNTSAIFSGQVWRLVSFVFVPQPGSNILFFAVTLYFYYFIGTALEQHWGSGKFTVFYGLGIILNIITGLFIGTTSMFYVNMSMFFAFATLYPDLQFLLFFLIPVKAKWLAWIDGAFFALAVLQCIYYNQYLLALIPLVAVLNYFLFFCGDFMERVSYQRKRVSHKRNPNTINFKAAQKHAREKKGYLHKCAVCGRTDVTNPELEFRYCSKCNGYYCYCSDHINSHVHVE